MTTRSPIAEAAREASESELDTLRAELADEEVRVLVLLAQRLLEGQRTYGHLDLANDRRDLGAERGAEIADLLVYSAMAELKRVLTNGGS